MTSKSLPAFGLEREYGEKIDRCLTDTLLKAGAGLVIGGIFSFTLFKKRVWPITLGTGIGLGIAYRNCEDNLRSHYLKMNENSQATAAKDFPSYDKVTAVEVQPLDGHRNEDDQKEIDLEEVKNFAESILPQEQSLSQDE